MTLFQQAFRTMTWRRRTRSSAHHRFGFTLVELLVATAVTLLLILAVTQAFATVSQTLRTTRATLEMAGKLRGVALRLQMDLEGATASVQPWVHASWGRGYLEYFDGPSNDMDSDANGTFDSAQAGVNTALGDVDDVIMLTVRSPDEPFSGRNGSTMIQSNVAEVAWWMLADTAGRYTLYRRALLVRPDLNTQPAGASFPYFFVLNNPPQGNYNVSSAADVTKMANDVTNYFNDNDVSVHFRRVETGNQVVLYAIANSLADLTIRRNRFCHDPIVLNNVYVTEQNMLGTQFPNPIYAGSGAALSLVNLVHTGNSLGEDIILPHVLAFDSRAYDPLALVVANKGADGAWGAVQSDDDSAGGQDDYGEAGWVGTDDEVSVPGDLGFGISYPAGTTPLSGSPKQDNIVSLGAFVDLNYFGKYPSAAWSNGLAQATYFDDTPYFGPAPNSKSKLQSGNSGTWDTWPFDYEADGIDQDGDSGAAVPPPSGTPNVDEGTNGVDDDVAAASPPDPPGYGRIDDETERETSPPYPFVLGGIQVRLRIIDPDTRRVRQTSVETRFSTD